MFWKWYQLHFVIMGTNGPLSCSLWSLWKCHLIFRGGVLWIRVFYNIYDYITATIYNVQFWCHCRFWCFLPVKKSHRPNTRNWKHLQVIQAILSFHCTKFFSDISQQGSRFQTKILIQRTVTCFPLLHKNPLGKLFVALLKRWSYIEECICAAWFHDVRGFLGMFLFQKEMYLYISLSL